MAAGDTYLLRWTWWGPRPLDASTFLSALLPALGTDFATPTIAPALTSTPVTIEVRALPPFEGISGGFEARVTSPGTYQGQTNNAETRAPLLAVRSITTAVQQLVARRDFAPADIRAIENRIGNSLERGLVTRGFLGSGPISLRTLSEGSNSGIGWAVLAAIGIGAIMVARSKNGGGMGALNIGQRVTLPAGHQVGMGKLRQSVNATVSDVQQNTRGELIYAVHWTDSKTKRKRYTWVTEREVA